MEVAFKTLPVSGTGIERVVMWAGLIAHAPHYDVAAQKGIMPKGVYTTWLWFGSPGARYNLLPTRRILAIDDQPTPDLDAFLAAIRPLKDRQAVRVTMENLSGVPSVKTIKMDLHYWPTQLIELRDGVWERTVVNHD